MRGRLLDGARWALVLVLGAAFLGAACAQSAADKADRTDGSAVLRVLNRDVITMRATVSGVGPDARVRRAEERLRETRPREVLDDPLRTEPLQLGNARGTQILLGDRLLFAVFEGDVDPTINQTHDALVKQTVANLEDVRRVWIETRRPAVVLDALVRAAVATAILGALVYGFSRGFRGGIGWLERRRDAVAAQHSRATLREFLFRFLVRVAQVLKWVVFLVLGYAWATYVLERFPLTQPIGQRLGRFIVDTLTWLGGGLVAGLPGLITVLIVFGVTRAIIDV
ncbi:MAG TPA: hypothetical protein VFN64_07480, partial [Burkholderiaceae bacterium]|nr:hypothetical protein [Burkholderiaceae bacterium]